LVCKPSFLNLTEVSSNVRVAYMVAVNKRRDEVYGPANKEDSNEAGMRDQTEFENKNFRYVL
jgi:hypothetical protein